MLALILLVILGSIGAAGSGTADWWADINTEFTTYGM